MLMRAYGIEADGDGTDNFDDAGDTYYTGYLAAAKRLGISNGVGSNMFEPESEIARQDMFTLTRFARLFEDDFIEMVAEKTTQQRKTEIADSLY